MSYICHIYTLNNLWGFYICILILIIYSLVFCMFLISISIFHLLKNISTIKFVQLKKQFQMELSIIFLIVCLQLVSCFNLFEKTQQKFLLKSNDDFRSTGPVFSYLGCFNDRKDDRDINERDFSYITKFNKTLPTVELCVSLCAENGFKIVGIQAL